MFGGASWFCAGGFGVWWSLGLAVSVCGVLGLVWLWCLVFGVRVGVRGFV